MNLRGSQKTLDPHEKDLHRWLFSLGGTVSLGGTASESGLEGYGLDVLVVDHVNTGPKLHLIGPHWPKTASFYARFHLGSREPRSTWLAPQRGHGKIGLISAFWVV